MGALTPAAAGSSAHGAEHPSDYCAGLPASCATPSDHSVSTHPTHPAVAFARYPLATSVSHLSAGRFHLPGRLIGDAWPYRVRFLRTGHSPSVLPTSRAATQLPFVRPESVLRDCTSRRRTSRRTPAAPQARVECERPQIRAPRSSSGVLIYGRSPLHPPVFDQAADRSACPRMLQRSLSALCDLCVSFLILASEMACEERTPPNTNRCRVACQPGMPKGRRARPV